MKRSISSARTYLDKIIFPCLWVALWGCAAVGVLINAPTDLLGIGLRLIIVAVWLASSAYLLRSAARLKLVSVDDKFLYVSNLLKEIASHFRTSSRSNKGGVAQPRRTPASRAGY